MLDGETSKPQLRRLLRQRREALGMATREAASQSIVKKVIGLVDWSRVQSVHCYMAISRNHEVESQPILTYIWNQQPHIVTMIPGLPIDSEQGSLLVAQNTSWQAGRVMPFPVIKQWTKRSPDLIIVPLLGFDDDCHRLGYGGGYYDRLLSRLTDSATVGLSFDCGYVAQGLPYEPHDIPLHCIVTEGRIVMNTELPVPLLCQS